MKKYLRFRTPILFHLLIFLTFCCLNNLYAQNSLIGDGFGGRGWYVPHNYQVGSYSGYTVCGANNQLYGWGNNEFGQLGDGSYTSSNTPVAAIGMTDVKFYTTGYVSGVIKSNNTAWLFGGGGFAPTPTQVLTNVKFLDGGSSHILFVKNDGTVWGAGNNAQGQLGNGTTTSPMTLPVQMTGINNAVRAVALGFGSHQATMILLGDRTVQLTGGYQWFSPDNNFIPVTVPGLSGILDIKGNTDICLALNTIGEVYVFGKEDNNHQGALGLGVYTGLYTAPTKLIFPAGAAPIIALSANSDGHLAYALDEIGQVYGWGDNRFGQLGTGTTTNINTPTLIADNAIDIYAGELFSYILKSDNSLWATGKSKPFSGSSSIWMNLANIERHIFTQIDPTVSLMNLCVPKVFGVLPVQLLNFNCKATGSDASLSWRSGEETNFSKFIVQYSQDGLTFQEIGSVGAKGSNSTYIFDHKNVFGIAYYRLKMVDVDGRFKYSEIRTVKFTSSDHFTITPNPAKDYINIYTKKDAIIKSVSIYSLDGRIVKTINDFNSGQHINIPDISRGMYILKTIDKKGEIEYGNFIKF